MTWQEVAERWLTYSTLVEAGAIVLAVIVANAIRSARLLRQTAPDPHPDADIKLIQNERLKLTATWLNTLGSGAMAIGVITPATVVAVGLERGSPADLTLIWAGAVWIFVAAGLHLAGRFVLRGLRA